MIFLVCACENNQQNMQMSENGWKWYQYHDILDNNWKMIDLDENMTDFVALGLWHEVNWFPNENWQQNIEMCGSICNNSFTFQN